MNPGSSFSFAIGYTLRSFMSRQARVYMTPEVFGISGGILATFLGILKVKA